MRGAEFQSGKDLYKEFENSPYYDDNMGYLELMQAVAKFIKNKNLDGDQRRFAFRKLGAQLQSRVSEVLVRELEVVSTRTINYSKDNPPPPQELFRAMVKDLYGSANEPNLDLVLDRLNRSWQKHYNTQMSMSQMRSIASNNSLSRALWSDAVGKWAARGSTSK